MGLRCNNYLQKGKNKLNYQIKILVQIIIKNIGKKTKKKKKNDLKNIIIII
jgi:menaquinone-dependent protoporphyrinogen IX oxidase